MRRTPGGPAVQHGFSIQPFYHTEPEKQLKMRRDALDEGDKRSPVLGAQRQCLLIEQDEPDIIQGLKAFEGGAEHRLAPCRLHSGILEAWRQRVVTREHTLHDRCCTLPRRSLVGELSCGGERGSVPQRIGERCFILIGLEKLLVHFPGPGVPGCA